jgi:dTDP-glucose pyrophosphorylase
MIYGLIPIGGAGTRLGLPYSKEMLPQKNFDYFNPLVNHIVEKMKFAGAEKICFVHGKDFKKDVTEFFDEQNHIHILQEELGFANVILDFCKKIKIEDSDKVIFGLPDSLFEGNPFIDLIDKKGIVTGLFVTNALTKVDRLEKSKNNFQIKVPKTENNLDLFWGVLKFDGSDLKKMIEDRVFSFHTEIGDILNLYEKTHVICTSYLDLGTWNNYNKYLTSTHNFSNNEIEKKFCADNVDINDFIVHFKDKKCKFLEVTSTDHYYTSNNKNIEFIRYRSNSQNDMGSSPDITIKNYNESQFNRFELVVSLSNQENSKNVMYFLKLMGANYEFSVTKKCLIFTFEDYTVVYYEFNVGDKLFKIIEIEMHKIDFNILDAVEQEMLSIPGFDLNLTIKKSKFQIIKDHMQQSINRQVIELTKS